MCPKPPVSAAEESTANKDNEYNNHITNYNQKNLALTHTLNKDLLGTIKCLPIFSIFNLT